jgi:hypothetical protein
MKMAVFWAVAPCSMKFADISEVLDVKSVNFYQTDYMAQQSKDRHLHTRSRENLKTHTAM